MQNGYFKDRFNKLNQQPSVDYDPSNIGEQHLIDMCYEHDFRVEHGKSHPKTDHQLQQQVAAKKKQQKSQMNKKKDGSSKIPQFKSKNSDETNS